MRFGDRSDQELIELARAGWAPAFAVLVHRYAPLVHAARPGDGLDGVAGVFLRAMRELDERDPRAPVTPWLLGLAGATTPPRPTSLSPEQLDRIWSALHERWPDGRAPTRHVHWQRTAAVVGLAALAGLVPAVVLGADGNGAESEPVEIRAVPLPDERSEEVAEAELEDEEPDFSFPTTPEEQDPAPEPEPDPEPAPVDPEPDPDPEPRDEDPDPVDEEDAEGEPEPGEEGDGDDGGGLIDGLVGRRGGDDGDDGGDGGDDGADAPDEGADEPVEDA